MKLKKKKKKKKKKKLQNYQITITRLFENQTRVT